MRRIKVMPDYFCYPLWENTDDGLINLSPCLLPISDDLKSGLENWRKEFDSIYNDSDPASSDFISRENEELFIEAGFKLAKKLKYELGRDFIVIYHILS